MLVVERLPCRRSGEKQGGRIETIINRSMLEAFQAGLRGAAYTPGEEGYDEIRKTWNLNAHQHPALVVIAAGAADVIAAVRPAHDEGLGVGVMATGHGVASPCERGLLINTSRMKGVRVDPESQTARVEPGALWADVISETGSKEKRGVSPQALPHYRPHRSRENQTHKIRDIDFLLVTPTRKITHLSDVSSTPANVHCHSEVFDPIALLSDRRELFAQRCKRGVAR
jgi:FAD binding domain